MTNSRCSPAATAAARAGSTARRLGLALALALVPVGAHALTPEQRAQLPSVLPPDAAGRIEQRLREAPTPPPTGVPPSLQVEPPPVERAPDSAANIPLQLEDVKLIGVTVYSREELAQYWKDKIGKLGTLGDLFAIAAEITARYRNDGYVLSRAIVPAQEIEDGKVELRVIEGYVDKVIFEGDDTRADILRATGNIITEARPVRVSDLERYLLLLGDQPGVNVSSVLRPSAEQTGAADLIVKLDRDFIQNFATLDSRGTRYVGPIQATVGTRVNSLFGLGDQTFMRAITTPVSPDELIAFDFNNTQSLDAEGTTAALQLNFAEAHPGFTLKPLQLVSDASTITVALGRPIIRSRVENLRLNLQFSVNEYRTEATTSAFTILHDNIRSVRAAAVWETIDKYRGANLVGLQFSQGLAILGATRAGTQSPPLSRAVGKADYSKLNFDLSRLQSLGGGWSLLAGATGQYAFTSLLASEQFGLGGSTFLRAYDPSDIVGDSGIGAKFELQYGDEPKTWYLQDYQAYVYLDLGRVQNLERMPGEKADDAAIAVGFGSRFTVTEWSSGYVEVGQPIMRGVTTEGTHDHFPRIFFALIAKF
jgi:hemolysin activation/secretion protein